MPREHRPNADAPDNAFAVARFSGSYFLRQLGGDFEDFLGFVLRCEPARVVAAFRRHAAFRMTLNYLKGCSVGPDGRAVPDASELVIVGWTERVELGVLAFGLPRHRMLELLIVDVR